MKYLLINYSTQFDLNEVYFVKKTKEKISIAYSKFCSQIYPKYRQKTLVKIETIGDNFRIKFKDKWMTLDASEIHHLRLLLDQFDCQVEVTELNTVKK